MKTLTIIGAGMMGSTFAFPVRENGNEVRPVSILLGCDYTVDEAMAELAGVTLESLVVAKRVARAIRVKAERGLADLLDFPLLVHIDEIITQKRVVDIPWEAFTFER